MGRELRRLLISPARMAAAGDPGDGAGSVLPLGPAESHYLRRVLRLRQGDRLAVVDGCGRLWTALAAAADRLHLEQPPQAPLVVAPRPLPALRLALALPKREVDLVWRMATELGADLLQPLLAERCLRRGEPPMQRWQSVLREATEQCERLWLPQLQPLQAALPWLAQPPGGPALFATTRREALPQLADLLRVQSWQADAPISLAIGPEGGWTAGEEAAAAAAGWRPVSLGCTILRSGTAAIAGISQLAAARQISCPSFPSPCP